MKIIYISSICQNAILKNTIKANIYCRHVAMQGLLPLSPNTIFPQYLDSEKKNERELGLKLSLELLKICDELWVFGEVFTRGMKKEIEVARKLKKKMRFFRSDTMEETT